MLSYEYFVHCGLHLVQVISSGLFSCRQVSASQNKPLFTYKCKLSINFLEFFVVCSAAFFFCGGMIKY